MNDYDSWQRSGFSGMGVHDFAPVKQVATCADCHMPLVASDDAGNISGKVHDHRFIGASVWGPLQREDQTQAEATIEFLRDSVITLDIFAMSRLPEPEVDRRRAVLAKHKRNPVVTDKIFLSSIAANELDVYDFNIQPPSANLHDSIIAPLDPGAAAVQPGESVRVDVVVRSRGVGHNFPAGAVDMSEAWLELKAVDDRGATVFWSGAVTATGQVDPDAHSYGAIMVDGLGGEVYHHEGWRARAAAHVNLLPPNSAEVVRFRIDIPDTCGRRLWLIAKLNYRQYRPQSLLPLLTAPDSTTRLTGNPRAPSNVDCDPEIPIVVMAQAETVLYVGTGGSTNVAVDSQSTERWRNYGIGLIRQNDLAGAEMAFSKVKHRTPEDADSWINLGMVWLRLGKIEAAKEAFQQAHTIL